MNPYTGHMVILADGMAAPAGYEVLDEKLKRHAEAQLAEAQLEGKSETHVDLRRKGPLQDWAKKKRKEKVAAQSRRRNRR